MFSCDWKKLCCWKRLKTLTVSEACTTIDKNIFVSSKICFEWNLFFIVIIFKNEDWLFSSKQFFLQNIWLNRRCCSKCVSKCSKKNGFSSDYIWNMNFCCVQRATKSNLIDIKMLQHVAAIYRQKYCKIRKLMM